MTTYAINEIFYSLQGEGRYTGYPMVFVRFAGCNLRCTWCDQADSVPLPGFELRFTMVPFDAIVSTVKSYGCTRVCFTGGEPLTHKVGDLAAQLQGMGHKIHVETNGTIYDTHPYDWICVSPKGPVDIRMYDRANEIKFIVDSAFHPDQVIIPKSGGQIYLQPCNEYDKVNLKSLNRTIELVRKNPTWALSTQAHKLWAVR